MEYIIQDSTLQGIADAIRSKAGTSDPIATSAFAEAIAAIEAGGGGKLFVTEMIPAEKIVSTNPITITHNLGVIPDFIIITRKLNSRSAKAIDVSVCRRCGDIGGSTIQYATTVLHSGSNSSTEVAGKFGTSELTVSTGTMGSSYSCVKKLTASTAEVVGMLNNTAYGWMNGVEHLVIMGVL